MHRSPFGWRGLAPAALAVAISVLAFADRAQGSRIFTVAGTGEYRETQVGGVATDVPLAGIADVTGTASGDVLIATSRLVWRLTPDGRMRVVAGTLEGGTDADGVPATQADLRNVAIAATGDGGFLLSTAGRVRKVDAAGLITTVAGTGEHENSGDGGPAVAAGLFAPWGLAALPDGGFLVSVHHLLRRVGADGIITTVAGTRQPRARGGRRTGS
jgi:serine/threonine protein kinase, bacterial